jgi:outer membrane lipoprotein SlyB
MEKCKSIIAIMCLATIIMSCARDIQSNVYSSASVGEASFTYQGTVISSRKVTVQKTEELDKNGTGIGVGAVAGGLAGNQFGGGSGNLAATVGGAILGGVAGALVEKKLKTQEAMEYVVKLTNNQILTVVQGLDAVYSVGQRVMVIVSHDGRSRVIPDTTPMQDVQTPIQTPGVQVLKKQVTVNH